MCKRGESSQVGNKPRKIRRGQIRWAPMSPAQGLGFYSAGVRQSPKDFQQGSGLLEFTLSPVHLVFKRCMHPPSSSTGSQDTLPQPHCFCLPSSKNYLTVTIKSVGNAVVYRDKHGRRLPTLMPQPFRGNLLSILPVPFMCRCAQIRV